LILELGEAVAAWPLGASLAAAAAARGLHAGRRRAAMNEALHELRRPLQALSLAAPGTHLAAPGAIQGSVQLAASALERLEREINGERIVSRRAPLLVRPLLAGAVGRWRAQAGLAGSSLTLRWAGGEATIEGDPCEISQALDNLIANAIEHGGPAVAVEAAVRSGRLRLVVVDSGCESRPGRKYRSPVESIARLRGRHLHGHGLRVVRRIAAAHGGEFHLRRSDRRTEAILELPLAGARGRR
jgi:signal transduction histidine kinase